MDLISVPGDGSPPRIQDWPDGGGIAVISWRAASGEVYRQELGSEREAAELLTKISASDDLDLISAQLRRRGVGPDS